MNSYTKQFKVTHNGLMVKFYRTDGTSDSFFFYNGDREKLINDGWMEIVN